MTFPLTLDQFLERSRISQDEWGQSGCDWESLRQIADDYTSQTQTLSNVATFLMKGVQTIPDVHSVRWRVKDTEHLLAKIVRKRVKGGDKYLRINVQNYFETVTDLVGLRVLHLFKDDCFSIDESLRKFGELIEIPIAYIRAGDDQEWITRLNSKGFETKLHEHGYRSLHYVLERTEQQRKVRIEVQVRTLFEEAWSEIDHKVRYPNFSDNAQVAYFLKVFNRLAGSADEMGGFVRDLDASLKQSQIALDSAVKEKEQALIAVETTLGELAQSKQQDATLQAMIKTLRQEVAKLRRASNRDNNFAASLLSSGLDVNAAYGDKMFRHVHSSRSLDDLLEEVNSRNAQIKRAYDAVSQSPFSVLSIEAQMKLMQNGH